MSRGAAPPGVSGEENTARWVREMFGRVAHRYDFLNHLLSFNADRWWRARTVRRLRHILDEPDTRALDLCCGSGDLMLALAGHHGKSLVLGSDFCHPMLLEAKRKKPTATLFEADAMQLPLPPHSMDLITIGFGFRNLANYHKGLTEIRRVLKPGGMAAILEFSQPAQPAVRRAVRLLLKQNPARDRRNHRRLQRGLYLSARVGWAGFRARRNWQIKCEQQVSRKWSLN